jgi:anion-transporting  ArsA/GET3 family ATPase
VRDVLLTGKVYEATRRNARNKGAIQYDAVVIDAPPTGRISAFLGVTSELAGLAKVGPVKHQSDNVTRLLRSEQTAVHLVTVLEEMPVQEAVDGIADLRAHDLPVGGVVVNMVRSQDLDEEALAAARTGTIDAEVVAAEIKRAGLDADDTLVHALLAEAHDHAERRALEDEQREIVDGLGVPTYELPQLTGGIDLGALYELAALLREQGMA